jgi:hypothetical protein
MSDRDIHLLKTHHIDPLVSLSAQLALDPKSKTLNRLEIDLSLKSVPAFTQTLSHMIEPFFIPHVLFEARARRNGDRERRESNGENDKGPRERSFGIQGVKHRREDCYAE